MPRTSEPLDESVLRAMSNFATRVPEPQYKTRRQSEAPGGDRRTRSLSSLLQSRQAASLIRLILDSFRDDDLQQWCLNHQVSYEELSCLRSAFVSAGSEGLLRLQRCPRWTQMTVTLDDTTRQWERLMAGEFQDRIRSWLAADSERAFFFVNKRPGIRLRALTSDSDGTNALAQTLHEMAAGRQILSWAYGSYEPEVFQFGGESGLTLAHAYFTAESLAVMAFLRARIGGSSSMSPERFSILLLDTLLRSVVEDELEVWDVWGNMELTGRLDRPAIQKYSAEGAGAPSQLRLRDQLRGVYFGSQRVAEPERAFFESYRSQTSPIAGKFRELDQTGRLLWNKRRILPFWIIFHWNRMRFSFRQQQRLSRLMVRLYSPKLIGAE
jgi:thiopeptide-type bacteriocin biosynthesis protein